MNTDEIQKYYVVDGIDEKHMADDYQVLRGPGGFKCVITEPEDRSFYRDLAPIRDELNRLQSEIDRLREELKIALSIANRSSKAVLKWNDEIEQQTKEALRVRLKIGLSETFIAAHGIKPQGDEITVTHDELIAWIDKAIDSVGEK